MWLMAKASVDGTFHIDMSTHLDLGPDASQAHAA
jgi:hypothetical protein